MYHSERDGSDTPRHWRRYRRQRPLGRRSHRSSGYRLGTGRRAGSCGHVGGMDSAGVQVAEDNLRYLVVIEHD